MSPPTPPLAHHALLALVEPFIRSGRRLDPDASDRARRVFVFQPTERAATAALPAMTERLQFEPTGADGRARLVRTLTLGDGTTATLTLEGGSAASLRSAMDTIDPGEQWTLGDGYVIAREDRARLEAGRPRLRPVGATVRLGATALRFVFPGAAGRSARFRLSAPGPDSAALGDDLFAVLGWRWSPLRKREGAWCGSVRVRGHGRERDQVALQLTRAAAEHLARRLGEGAERFHERWLPWRIGVALRRALPQIACALMLAEALLAPALRETRGSAVTAVLVALPALLLLAFLFFSEDPRIERPRWPRRPVPAAG